MKKHIDDLTQDEMNLAVAVAQGWRIDAAGGVASEHFAWINDENQPVALVASYRPTTLQHDCGRLIDKYHIDTVYYKREKKWLAKTPIASLSGFLDKSRLVAVCKAFLFSVYPDGMVELCLIK